VVDAEQRGAKMKKKLEIDPIHADTVRLAFKLALEGDGTSGPMGVKSITKHLNERRIFTRRRPLGHRHGSSDADPADLYRPPRVQQARQEQG
jgi:hypothetical protein